jgi:hypothetical protein
MHLVTPETSRADLSLSLSDLSMADILKNLLYQYVELMRLVPNIES